MKLSEVIPFLTFSAIADHSEVERQFNECHAINQSRFPYWSVHATRYKMISRFWYETVIRHFIAVYFVGLLIAAFSGSADWIKPGAFLMFAGLCLFTFLVLLLFIYLPAYQSLFLPLLDSYLETYSGRQLEGLQKCKKEQYSVFALMLIQYCYNRMSDMTGNLLTEPFPRLLMKQYGVSPKMIDATLRTIILNNWDRSKPRKQTEIREAFEEAIEYFEGFESQKAIQILTTLKQKILNRAG